MNHSDKDRRIDYIELITSDITQCKNFYKKAFEWTFKDYGPDYCEFSDGRMTGGFTTAGSVRPGGPLIILYADDLEEMQQRVEDAGATIVKRIFSFPGGRRFHFEDPNGYELAVWSDQ